MSARLSTNQLGSLVATWTVLPLLLQAPGPETPRSCPPERALPSGKCRPCRSNSPRGGWHNPPSPGPFLRQSGGPCRSRIGRRMQPNPRIESHLAGLPGLSIQHTNVPSIGPGQITSIAKLRGSGTRNEWLTPEPARCHRRSVNASAVVLRPVVQGFTGGCCDLASSGRPCLGRRNRWWSPAGLGH